MDTCAPAVLHGYNSGEWESYFAVEGDLLCADRPHDAATHFGSNKPFTMLARDESTLQNVL